MHSSSCWRGLCPVPSSPQMISVEPEQLFVKKAPQPAERKGTMTPCWSQGSRSSVVIPHPAMPCSIPGSPEQCLGAPALLKVSVPTPLPYISHFSLHCERNFPPPVWQTMGSKLPSLQAAPAAPSCLRFQCSCGINMLGLVFFPWLLKGQDGSVLNL